MTLKVRQEASLPRHQELIRAGGSSREAVTAALENTYARFQIHGISVLADRTRGTSEFVKFPSGTVLDKYSTYRVANVGSVEDLGWSVLATFDAPHYTLVFPRAFDETLWNEFQLVFSKPIKKGV